MADSIVRSISREVMRAFIRGNFSVNVFGKTLKIEHVISKHWRVTDNSGNDIGLRFDVESGKCRFFLA